MVLLASFWRCPTCSEVAESLFAPPPPAPLMLTSFVCKVLIPWAARRILSGR
ncbi:hypothetical protein HispidOSU_020591 [Sigmodon hispidus]